SPKRPRVHEPVHQPANVKNGTTNNGETDIPAAVLEAVKLPPNVKLATLSHPQQRVIDGILYPLILVPSDITLDPKTHKPISSSTFFSTTESLTAWLKEHNSAVALLAQHHGVVFFRGFPVPTSTAFDAFVSHLGFDQFEYVGGAAPRTVITPRVFTANESPSHEVIPFHHELAQSKSFPGRVIFWCEISASSGGQTPTVLSNVVYERIRKEMGEFAEEIEGRGVRYVRYLPREDDPSSAIGRGWRNTLLVETREEAEKKCKELDMDFEWRDGDILKTISPVLSPIKLDTRTNKTSWFNSIIAAYTGWQDSRNDRTKAVVYGDGTPLPADKLERIKAIMDECCVKVDWQVGDVMLVDNWVSMHAREPFVGKRRILASLWK
ncbi:hypothetical protein HK102_009340, partial [Quaeritorhiza haematococci]